jgi:hypothetical protein
MRRLIAFGYLVFRVLRQNYFQAFKQWEKCGSFKRWRVCFFDRATFSCHWTRTKEDFRKLYAGWRDKEPVSLNGNEPEFNLLEQWWVNVGDRIRELESARKWYREEWLRERSRGDRHKNDLYAAWMALDDKQEEIQGLQNQLKNGVS